MRPRLRLHNRTLWPLFGECRLLAHERVRSVLQDNAKGPVKLVRADFLLAPDDEIDGLRNHLSITFRGPLPTASRPGKFYGTLCPTTFPGGE